ncbi:GntR family transcriptional regulator [Porticoccaceae bacterium]|nr:GntR family transcriptional regulator [Porticoccaceae bacterium]MDC1453939.1 GntR family transcriptional regulator [Porticoccaceae bacterium]
MSKTSSATLFTSNLRRHISAALPAPLYHQLYSLIKNYILDGSLHHGDKLPGEQELAELFDVSRITAKRAVNELAAEHLVERARGRGTHIIYKYSPKPFTAPVIAVLEEIESMAESSTSTVLECDMVKPPQAISTEFGLKRGDTLMHLARTRERGGRKFAYLDSWTIGIQAPENHDIFSQQSRYQFFRDHDIHITHITQIISAIAASPIVAKHLDIEVGTPLLSLVRHSFRQNAEEEELVDYINALFNPELFQYQMDHKLD